MRKWNKLLSLLLAMVMAFGMTAVALADEETGDAAPTAAEPETGKIVILHTNDVHCGVDQKTDDDGAVTQIGYTGVAAYKAEMEAQYGEENVTLVDAGDHVQGDVIGAMSKGEAILPVTNAVGYDLASLGNHEFDFGLEQMLKLTKELAEYPYLCCNFVDLKTGEPVFDPYTILTYGDVKVAYVGVLTPQTFSSSTPTYFQDADGNYIYGFCEGENGAKLYETVQKNVDAAKAEGADYVIVVGHMGVEVPDDPYSSISLIKNTTGIDAMIDGHSHTVYTETVPNKDGKDVIINQTGTKLANIGKIVIDTETKEISAELVGGYKGNDEAVDAVVTELNTQLEELTSEVVAKTDVLLTNYAEDGETRLVRTQETNMGDLFTDAIRTVLGTDVAIYQGGGIRADIPAGDITNGQMIAVDPWSTELGIKEVTGQTLLDALEWGARKNPEENGGFLQVSGLTYTIDRSVADSTVADEQGLFASVDGDYRVKDVMVGDEPLDLEKTYTVGSSHYILAESGDGMTMFAGCDYTLESAGEAYKTLITYITDNLGGSVGEDYAEPQGRITLVGEPAAPAEPEEPETPAALFSDVSESNWHYEFVKKMVDAGAVKGYEDGSFKPGNQVTWGEALKMVMAPIYGEQAPVEGGTWASGYIAKAVEEKLIDAEVEQNKNITRVELCQLAAKANGIAASETESTFSDTDDAYVVALAEAGVVNGYEDGTFKPDGELTRAELCKILATVVKGEGEATEPAEPAEDAAYTTETVSIENDGRKVPAIVTLPAGEGPFPAVVINHGHGGSKDENTGFPGIAKALAEAGIASIRMDFPGCGDSTEPFTANTLTNMKSDSNASLAYLLANYPIDETKVGILGYSMGGRLALEIVSEDDNPYIAVALLSAAANPGEELTAGLLGDTTLEEAKAAAEAGSYDYTTQYGQELSLSAQWFDDIMVDPLANISKYTGPMLVLHGDKDDVVTDETNKLIIAAYPDAQEIIVPEADHGYGFYSDQPDVTAAVEGGFVEFFTANLIGEAAEPAQAA